MRNVGKLIAETSSYLNDMKQVWKKTLRKIGKLIAETLSYLNYMKQVWKKRLSWKTFLTTRKKLLWINYGRKWINWKQKKYLLKQNCISWYWFLLHLGTLVMGIPLPISSLIQNWGRKVAWWKYTLLMSQWASKYIFLS